MATIDSNSPLAKLRDATTAREITRALLLTEGNHSWAANLLGIHRSTLYRLLRRYDIRLEFPDRLGRRPVVEMVLARSRLASNRQSRSKQAQPEQ